LQTEIIYPHIHNWTSHLTYSLLLHYLEKNATAYTSSRKLLNKSAMHAVISLLLQSRKFWCYLLLFRCWSAPRRHNDVILLSAIRRVSGNDFVFQQDSAPAHRAAHVQQLNCCVKKRRTFLRPTCGLQTALIWVLRIRRSGLSCSIVSTSDKFIVWMNLNGGSLMSAAVLDSRFLMKLCVECRGRYRACVHAKEGHFE